MSPFQAPPADRAHARVVFDVNVDHLEGINQINRASKLFMVQLFVEML